VIADEEAAARLYGDILRHNPVHGRYAGIRLAGEAGPTATTCGRRWPGASG
jgi:hypothetical protein